MLFLFPPLSQKEQHTGQQSLFLQVEHLLLGSPEREMSLSADVFFGASANENTTATSNLTSSAYRKASNKRHDKIRSHSRALAPRFDDRAPSIDSWQPLLLSNTIADLTFAETNPQGVHERKCATALCFFRFAVFVKWQAKL